MIKTLYFLDHMLSYCHYTASFMNKSELKIIHLINVDVEFADQMGAKPGLQIRQYNVLEIGIIAKNSGKLWSFFCKTHTHSLYMCVQGQF